MTNRLHAETRLSSTRLASTRLTAAPPPCDPIPVAPEASSPPAFARPTPRRVRAWQTDAPGRAVLARFIEDRGAVRPRDAVLCALYWLEQCDAEGDGRAGDAAVRTSRIPLSGTTGWEIGARYPFHRGRRIASAASALASLAKRGLVQSVAVGWYHTTALGRAVVEAMPDVDQVTRLRGLRRRPSRQRRTGVV